MPPMGVQPPVLTPEQRAEQERAEAERRIEEARAKARREAEERAAVEGGSSGEGSDPPPTNPTKPDYRRAIPVPGREGLVFNPWTNNPVDVRGIPSGQLVRDPHDPNPSHKFRVP
jgi:hypothetical protein